MGQYFQYLLCTSRNKSLSYFYNISKALNYFLLLCFCFKNLDLLCRQTTQLDFSLSTFFVIFTSCGLKLCVKSLHLKQYVVSGLLPIFIDFIFDCVFFIFCNFVKCFWHLVLILLILSLQVFTAILLITSFTAFFFAPFWYAQIYFADKLINIKLRIISIAPNGFKIMSLKHVFSFFFIISVIIFMISLINFDNKV